MGKEKGSKKTAASSSAKKGMPVVGQQQPPPAQRPDWPPFKPALPVTDLDFVSPAPGYEDKVVLVRNFWPRALCRDYVAFLQGLPLSTTPGRPKRGEAVRVNDRFQVHDPDFSQKLWAGTGLREAILDQSVQHLWGGKPLSLNPNIRVYRYSPNMFFDCHYDDSNVVTIPSPDGPDRSTTGRTTWTLLLYLTSSAEGCHGGETAFYPHDRKTPKEALVVAPETGMLLLHKHGDDCLLHEGREVTAGHKWILRTDLVVEQ